MSEEEAIKFAGLMEDYLNIPSFVCEMIEKQLEDNKYKEVVKYIIQRRNEIESKENYISHKLGEKDKEIKRLNNIINEIEKDIKNLYTYGIKNNREQKDYLLNRLECLKELKGSDKE